MSLPYSSIQTLFLEAEASGGVSLRPLLGLREDEGFDLHEGLRGLCNNGLAVEEAGVFSLTEVGGAVLHTLSEVWYSYKLTVMNASLVSETYYFIRSEDSTHFAFSETSSAPHLATIANLSVDGHDVSHMVLDLLGQLVDECALYFTVFDAEMRPVNEITVQRRGGQAFRMTKDGAVEADIHELHDDIAAAANVFESGFESTLGI